MVQHLEMLARSSARLAAKSLNLVTTNIFLTQARSRRQYLPSPYTSLTYQSTLMGHGVSTVIVGLEKQPFSVHKGYLGRCSEYFGRALNGRFIEATSGELYLNNESFRTFSQFLVWMYRGHVRIPPKRSYRRARASGHSRQASTEADIGLGLPDDLEDEAVDLQDGDDDNEQEWTQRNLIELYIFADRREVPGLRDAVMTKLVTDSEHMDGYGCGWALTTTYFDHVRLAFDNLPANATLLRYLTAEAAWFWREQELTNKAMHTLPAPFLAGVLNASPAVAIKRAEGWRGYAPWREDLCLFHEHNAYKNTLHHACDIRRSALQRTLEAKIVRPKVVPQFLNTQ
ncbi:hypothetical protein LTR36_010531 [Oleoguttula mirabilis]|uniref:BTB domain-containing protein n=1 Tax=Oleoguttula mirabilis TaxID=1507867 RepID=A0AAV9J4P9_9PEZI|nr:hypothetical protein LTR36_010531 [Oleoguttula mirabilis]